MLVAGLYALGWGFREASLAWRLRRRGLCAEGIVVENIRYVDPDSTSPHWAPVVAFTDNAGNRVEFTPQGHGGSLGLSTGRRVQVIYLPESSQDARVNTWQHLLLPSLIAMIAGLVCIGVVALIMVYFLPWFLS